MKVAFKKPVSTLFLLPQLNKNYTHSHTRAHTLPLGDLVGLWILGGGCCWMRGRLSSPRPSEREPSCKPRSG